MKETDPEAVLIGEVWERCLNKWRTENGEYLFGDEARFGDELPSQGGPSQVRPRHVEREGRGHKDHEPLRKLPS